MLVDGVKFSCKPCLLGHRSANCGHGDRHLFEVKKKGRPSTQCDECKAKRERTGGHIRCVCPRPEGERRTDDETINKS
ncbi:copper fist DNA binding domain-domain-containing protein [Leucosporidium creatinivorum]|uniref:Copper fist DNA binding domain-domain-containing protein n=1 Tax=Leucosporidium creatinivorum TaxID=106004 RepID=A0A1Y2EMV9_9BASI|nr:copper fist DNA binding domain-domain-containing protein [Leucosporidium creatinivorum]